jgi:hypothetical protein
METRHDIVIVPLFIIICSKIFMNIKNKIVLFVCDDFSSRCGDTDDFIAGIDNIEPRNIVDFNTHSYGDHLIQFLIESDMCILNGRNYFVNDFTSLSVKGCSIVYYCLVSHESLKHFTYFNVIRTSDLNFFPRNIPDHTVLNWNKNNIDIGLQSSPSSVDYETHAPTFDKFDLNIISDCFLSSYNVMGKINLLFEKLDQGLGLQNDLAIVYDEWCKIVKSEMYEILSDKTIYPNDSVKLSNRKRKPWWTKT